MAPATTTTITNPQNISITTLSLREAPAAAAQKAPSSNFYEKPDPETEIQKPAAAAATASTSSSVGARSQPPPPPPSNNQSSPNQNVTKHSTPIYCERVIAPDKLLKRLFGDVKRILVSGRKKATVEEAR